MNADHEKAKSIFLNAAELASPVEREAYIASACGDNRELRDEVAGLLKHHAKAGQFLEGVAADVDVTANQPITEKIGQFIGPYKLLQQIGEGGMGTVYMAEQSKPIQRKVAIKVIKPGMDSAQVIARFEAERQALALMDHVNIARVFDGGTTASGRPYFVMELVHGVPITKYCDDNHLAPRERLDLFVPVCQAIQHAHQKGIIHRDIKPSNVMVTLYDGKPVPKVIDFGVAKATEQKLTERTLFTHYGTLVGTLEYMSPEQAEMSALGVDTRSDIYSLGVLLYELLTGSTPIGRKRMKEAAYGEILRMIKEEDPPRPSTRLSESGEALASISALRHTEPAKLTKLVRGELDWIVMKCLEKDRNRRYETANGFAADLQRHLADETVQACPPSLAYRVQKFTRRYRKLLVTSAIIAVLLVTTTAISTWQWREAAVQRNRAENKTAEAAKNLREARKSVDDWFTTISQTTLLDAPGLQPLRKQLLESALVYYQGLSKKAADDPELRADLAAAHMRMSVIYVSLDRNDDAIVAILEGLDMVEQLLKEQPDDTEFPKRLAGFFRAPRQLYQRTRPPADAAKAAKTLERAAEIWEQFARTFPEISEFRGDLAGIHALLGGLTQSPDPKRSLSHARRSHELLEELVRSKPSDASYNELLVHAYSEMIYLLERAGSPKESQQLGMEVIRFYEKLGQEFPNERGLRHRLAMAQSQFAERVRAARPKEAEPLYRKSIAILETVTAESPTNSQYRRDLSHTYHAFSAALRQWNRETEADEFAAKSLAVNEKLVLEFPDMPEFRQALASRYSSQANRLAMSQPLEAVVASRQALEIHEKLVADFPKDDRLFKELEKTQSQLVALLQSTGQYEKLEQIWRQAISRYETLAKTGSLSRESKLHLARCHNRLGLLLRSKEKAPEAEIELRLAQRLWSEMSEPELQRLRKIAEVEPLNADPRNRNRWANLSLAYFQYGRWEDALQILDAQDRVGGSAWQWFHNAMAHWQLNHQEEAYAHFYKSVDWVENAMEKGLLARQSEAATLMQLPDLGNRPEQGWNYLRAAKEHESKGERDRVVADYGKAAEFYESLYLQFPTVPAYRKRVVEALQAAGKSHDILRIDQEAIAALEKTAAAHPRIALYREVLGRLLRDGGQLDRAEAEYAKAIELRPGSWETWHGRALVRSRKRIWELAVADYTESIRLSPNQHPNWWHRGHANLALKNWDAAAADFSGFVERWGDVGEAWYLRAIANAQRNQLDAAMADLRKARSLKFALADRLRGERRLDPLREREDFRDLLVDAAVLSQLKSGKREEAHASFIKLLESLEGGKDERMARQLSETAAVLDLPDPNSLCLSAWKATQTAAALEAQKGGDPAKTADAWLKSQECYERLVIAFPAVPAFRTSLIATLKKTNRLSELSRIDRQSLTSMEKLVAAVPKCIEYRFTLGKRYQSLGEKEKAEAEFAEAIKQAPKSWIAWNERAAVRFHSRQWEGAIADYTEAIKLAPEVHSSWWHRGHSYLHTSQWDKAAADFTTVLDGWPRGGEGLVLRAVALAQLQQPDKAVADIGEAIAIGFNNVGWLKSDARLDPLREREDFRNLIQVLERKERPVN